jgi:serine protease Do
VAIRSQRRISDSSRMPDDDTHRNLRGRVVPAVGSGVVISADGCILTNYHVVENAEPERITCDLADGQSFHAVSVTGDSRSDLAIIRVEATDLTPIRMGDLSKVRQGHFVVALGNPYGTASENNGRPALCFGVVSGLGMELTRQLDPLGERYYGNLIQTDAHIHPGNSGGPLINIKGELIGINTAVSLTNGSTESMGYAISIDKRTRDIITRLSRGEKIEYGYLGVNLDAPTAADRNAAGAPRTGGALVRDVRPGTPAEAAKLQAGDVIIEFDGEQVQNRDHLVRLVGASRVNTDVAMLVYRAKKQVRLQVRPGARPTDLRVAVNTSPSPESFLWRGMKLTELSPTSREAHNIADDVQGLIVTQVITDGPADQAGIRPGEVLRKVGDVPINGLRRLKDIAPSLSGPLKVVMLSDVDQEVTLP